MPILLIWTTLWQSLLCRAFYIPPTYSLDSFRVKVVRCFNLCANFWTKISKRKIDCDVKHRHNGWIRGEHFRFSALTSYYICKCPTSRTNIFILSKQLSKIHAKAKWTVKVIWYVSGSPRPEMLKSLSRIRLFATPLTVAYQAPLSMGFSRQEHWSGLPFSSPGDLPNPGIEPRSPTL